MVYFVYTTLLFKFVDFSLEKSKICSDCVSNVKNKSQNKYKIVSSMAQKRCENIRTDSDRDYHGEMLEV